MAPNFEALHRWTGAGHFLLGQYSLNDAGNFFLDQAAEPLTQNGLGGEDGEEAVGQLEADFEEAGECGEAGEDLPLGGTEEGRDTGSAEMTFGGNARQSATLRKSTGDREAGRGLEGKSSFAPRLLVQTIVKRLTPTTVSECPRSMRPYRSILEEATEDDFKRHMWHVMRLNNSCTNPAVCPVLHVWFARDRGGNYGFVEMASVEEAHAALRLDGMLWHGLPIRINRPTDWKNSVADDSVLGALAGELVARHKASQRSNHQPVDLIQSQIQADLLSGQPSRVVHIACPSKIEKDEEYDEILNDILTECNKCGHALAALIIRPELEQYLPSVTVGDIYLEYASCIQADHIILTFSGRMYDGKPLQLQRFNELAWRQTFHQHATPLLSQVFEKALEGLQPQPLTLTANVAAVASEAAGGDKDRIGACTAGAAAALAFLNCGPQTTSPTIARVTYGPQPQPASEAPSEGNTKDHPRVDGTKEESDSHTHYDSSVTGGIVGRISASTTCSE
ncbi:putative splicing factor U2AF 65 kDa subunit [Neospora caninum Liverpool]|uniref:Putative splicing factor U2AF 65 kDa subunit n=1 Tax=Neospora caninum (strain Liverpool) TaxID=572307 RepID=F0VNK5_NEOCL|nr:putative splicing factor U2AF 65 kDa subunit [Neospora caninum Liverpool]CBZ55301.1 putative splicing factor U2AF 65 kDa subunit [Neospora caninum Liverpool]CEL70033.1 TPA: splicing factor U2AF 65 kDa subunit, putative [Neospora caninum Liverpool]|eukprot:XP_003885329.1 putative splicing factor U2AF 65 kDa subunit [Neospora caninum Liverpool]